MKQILTRTKRLKLVTNESELLSRLGITKDAYQKCCRIGPLLYKEISLPKKDGGYRTISVPTKDLKTIQRTILDKIFSDMRLPPYVYGFSKGKSIIENAQYHAHNQYLLNLDIKNFFPSVHFKRVLQIYIET